MKVVFLPLILVLAACGKPAEYQPPRMETIQNEAAYCWRINDDRFLFSTGDWVCTAKKAQKP